MRPDRPVVKSAAHRDLTTVAARNARCGRPISALIDAMSLRRLHADRFDGGRDTPQ